MTELQRVLHDNSMEATDLNRFNTYVLFLPFIVTALLSQLKLGCTFNNRLSATFYSSECFSCNVKHHYVPLCGPAEDVSWQSANRQTCPGFHS